MKLHEKFTRSQKADIIFNEYVQNAIKAYSVDNFAELTPEMRDELFSMRDSSEKRLKETEKRIKELRRNGNLRDYEGFQVYDLDLEVGELGDKERSLNRQGVSRLELDSLKILNLKDHPVLEQLRRGLEMFFLIDPLYRCVSADRLDQVIETGFDKPGNTGCFAPYFSKAENYGGSPPKLVLMYDPNEITYLDGRGEGYEYQFKKDPKESLLAVLNLRHAKGESNDK